MPHGAPWLRFLRWARTGPFSPAIGPLVYMTQLLLVVWLAAAFTHFLVGAPKDFDFLRVLTIVVLSGAVAYGVGARFLHLPKAVEPWVLGPLASISGFMTLELLVSVRRDVPSALLWGVIFGIALGSVIWLRRRLTVTPNNRSRGP